MESVLKLTEQELNRVREVAIHDLLNIKNNGRKVLIRCPFHNERTGSFCLYPDNSFHCFGCNKNGQNALDFVMGLNGGDFLDAVSELVKYI